MAAEDAKKGVNGTEAEEAAGATTLADAETADAAKAKVEAEADRGKIENTAQAPVQEDAAAAAAGAHEVVRPEPTNDEKALEDEDGTVSRVADEKEKEKEKSGLKRSAEDSAADEAVAKATEARQHGHCTSTTVTARRAACGPIIKVRIYKGAPLIRKLS